MKHIILFSKMDPIPDSLLNAVYTGSYGFEVRVEYETERVQKFINKKACDVLICTEPDYEMYKLNSEIYPDGYRILITDRTMEDYSGELQNQEEILVDNIISYIADGYLTRLEIITTLQKTLHDEIFGLDKYLEGGTRVVMKEVISAASRDQLNSEVMEYANNHKVGT